jgi:hypothetical protein
VTMKASALSAAIPILGRSAEDRKQMKRADPFGLVLRVRYSKSICQNLDRL